MLATGKPDATRMLDAMAVGDSLGLPHEGIEPSWKSESWDQEFLFGYGITSDDTQHAVLTLDSIYSSGYDSLKFRKILGWRLACWFLSVPPGIGFATLRSCIKLIIGLRAPGSGVWSAGNGPAMRALIIGWIFWDDIDEMTEFVGISTKTTHSNPKAFIGAMILARTVGTLRGGSRNDVRELWRHAGDKELQDMVDAAVTIEDPAEFLSATGQHHGVGGYIYHTVASAFHAWWHHPDGFELAVSAALGMGGDTDSAAAVVAALCGAEGQTPPERWLRILDLPSRTCGRWRYFRQLWLNILATLTIFAWHIPRRICVRICKR